MSRLRSIGETARIFEALVLTSTEDPVQMARNTAARKLPTPEAEKQRRELRAAIALKDREFNTHGVEPNQRYASSAVVPDGTPMPQNPGTTSSTTWRPRGVGPKFRTHGWAGGAPRCPLWTWAGMASSRC
jgi:2,4-dichlorophenol 6-monooxygenase